MTIVRRSKPGPREPLEIDGRQLMLSSLDKVLWPSTGFTKRQLIGFYRAVAPALLPHLRRRPLTLGRGPDGVEGLRWYQTNCRGHPDWIATHDLVGKQGQPLRMCVVDDLPSLVWVANLGTLELHPHLWLTARPGQPTSVVFDLDPIEPAGLSDCCRVAVVLRDRLDAMGLDGVAKTSGSAGLHIFVPLAPGHSWSETKAFARMIAKELAELDPGLITDRSARPKRRGMVLVDWLQNEPMRSTVAPYSLRAQVRPWVSTPVTWSEVESALAHDRPGTLRFGPDDVLARLDQSGDLFAPVLAGGQALPPSPVTSDHAVRRV